MKVHVARKSDATVCTLHGQTLITDSIVLPDYLANLLRVATVNYYLCLIIILKMSMLKFVT